MLCLTAFVSAWIRVVWWSVSRKKKKGHCLVTSFANQHRSAVRTLTRKVWRYVSRGPVTSYIIFYYILSFNKLTVTMNPCILYIHVQQPVFESHSYVSKNCPKKRISIHFLHFRKTMCLFSRKQDSLCSICTPRSGQTLCVYMQCIQSHRLEPLEEDWAAVTVYRMLREPQLQLGTWSLSCVTQTEVTVCLLLAGNTFSVSNNPIWRIYVHKRYYFS